VLARMRQRRRRARRESGVAGVGQGVLDTLGERQRGRGGDRSADGAVLDEVEGEGVALGTEFNDEVVARGGGAVFDRQA
jgi:hypothetical protein